MAKGNGPDRAVKDIFYFFFFGGGKELGIVNEQDEVTGQGRFQEPK